MREKLTRLMAFLGGRDSLLLLTLTLAAYALMEKAGLFRVEPAGWREIFHSMPVKVLSVLIALSSMSGMIACIRSGRGLLRVGSLVFYLSILTIAAGLWTSIYTRFEGNFIIAEGQSFSAFKDGYVQETLYISQEKMLPQLGFNFYKIRPEASKDMRRLERISADVSYAGRTTKKIIDTTIGSDYPLISDWTIARFADFGYAIKFVLYDLNEKELERNYYRLKMFPPGAEDNVETMFLGYRFYIRCYPDYVDNNGSPGTRSPNLNNPVFNLRIVRNKDIVYDGLVKPTEKVRFDNVVVSLPEVKMWVEMALVRDLGLPVAAAGVLLMVLGVGMMWLNPKTSIDHG